MRGNDFGSPFPQFWNQPGAPSLFKPHESLEVHGDNPWLYSSVTRVSFQIAETEFYLQVAKKDDIEFIEVHQALETLRLPQPVEGGKSLLTSMDLMIVTSQHLMLNGESFWLLDRRLKASGAPTNILPLLPGFMEVELRKGLLRYTYRLPDRQVELDPVDVVHFKMPDPKNWVRGHNPTQSIRYALDTHKEADVMNYKRLRNNAVPGGVLSTEQNLSEEDINRLKQQWRETYGGSDNAGKTAYLPKGLKFDKVQESNQEMQFTEGKDKARDEILANFGIGLEILGKTESQTRANAEAAIFVFMKFGIKPFLMKICDTLNNDYLPAFPGTEKMEFAFDDPVPENMEEKRLNSEKLFQSGALTPDEMRKEFGLEPLNIKGVTDVPYIGFNMMPSTASPPSLAA